MPRLLFCLLLGLLGLPAYAGVYTYLDADGNRVFTDQPPSGQAQKIEIAPSNNMSPNQVTPHLAPVYPAQVEPAYEVLRIVIPEPDATIIDQAGNLIITASSDPGLHPGHSYRLIVDGQANGKPGRSPVFPLENVDRGTHQISVEIIDSQGRIVERTPSQPFHMKRISLSQKRTANPCKKGEWGVRPECPLSDKPAEPKDIPYVPFI